MKARSFILDLAEHMVGQVGLFPATAPGTHRIFLIKLFGGIWFAIPTCNLGGNLPCEDGGSVGGSARKLPNHNHFQMDHRSPLEALLIPEV